MKGENNTFGVLKLHDFSERCWAVVNENGAIVLEAQRLLMRLTRQEAVAIAASKNLYPKSYVAPFETTSKARRRLAPGARVVAGTYSGR